MMMSIINMHGISIVMVLEEGWDPRASGGRLILNDEGREALAIA